MSVTIVGTGFRAPTLTIGGARVGYNGVGDKLFATLPEHAPGLVDVTLVNYDGESVTRPGAFTILAIEAFDLNGVWEGGAVPDFFSVPLRLTVENDHVVSFSCGSSGVIVLDPAPPLTNGRFVYTGTKGESIDGVFNRPTSVDGSDQRALLRTDLLDCGQEVIVSPAFSLQLVTTDTQSRSIAPSRSRSIVLGALLAMPPADALAQRLPIKTYTTADGLAHNTVNRIVKDSRGFLWFCTAGGLSRFDGYTFTNFGPDQGLPHSTSLIFSKRAPASTGSRPMAGLVHFDPKGRPRSGAVHETARDPARSMFTVIVAGRGRPARRGHHRAA